MLKLVPTNSCPCISVVRTAVPQSTCSVDLRVLTSRLPSALLMLVDSKMDAPSSSSSTSSSASSRQLTGQSRCCATAGWSWTISLRITPRAYTIIKKNSSSCSSSLGQMSFVKNVTESLQQYSMIAVFYCTPSCYKLKTVSLTQGLEVGHLTLGQWICDVSRYAISLETNLVSRTSAVGITFALV